VAEKKTLSAKQVLADIRAGMSDEQLIKKYELSPKGLESLFGKLMKAGLVSKADLDKRLLASEGQVDASVNVSENASPKAERTRDVLRDFAQRFNIPREDIERLKTASIGDIKAFFAKHDIPLHEGKDIFKALGFKAGDLAAEAKESLLEGFRSIKEGVDKGSLKAFPTKLLAIGATAVMLGWLIAGLLTTGWLWFLIWLVVLAAVACLGLFFIGEKSKLKGKLTAAHFGAAAAVILVLNVAFLGGALKSDMSQWESVHGQALHSPQYLLKRDLLCSLHPARIHGICSDGGRLEDRVEEGEAILLLNGSTVENPGIGGGNSFLKFTTYSRQRGRLDCFVCNTEDIKTSFSPRLWPK